MTIVMWPPVPSSPLPPHICFGCLIVGIVTLICKDDVRSFLKCGGSLYLGLQHNVWLEDALDRAKQLYLSHYRAMPKSLERATAHRLMRAMFDGEERFIEPSPQAIEKLTLPVVQEAVMQQLVPSNMEVCHG
jgi:hypothetical protein